MARRGLGVAAFGVLALAACDPVLGTNDTELDYLVDATAGEIVRIDADWRLHAASISADVEQRGGHLRVTLDRRSADAATRMLAWAGGLEVHLVEPAGTQVDADHLVVHAADGQMLVIQREPLGRSSRDGVGVQGKSVIAPIAATTAELLRRNDADEVALLIAGRVYWHGPLRDRVRAADGDQRAAILLPRGDDVTAYRRARSTAKVLRSPMLPPLTLIGRRDVPTDWSLALASTLLPFVIGVLWLVLVRRFDRARPEPWWLMLATFGLGGGSQLVAGWIELGAWRTSPYLDHQTMSLDHSIAALPLSYLLCLVVVGVVEEGVKLGAVWLLARRRREFDEPIDGVIYACAAAVGFAAAENVVYFTMFRLTDVLTTGRSLMSMSGHMMMSAIWGYALGMRLVSKRQRVWPYFLLSAALHAAWDTVIDFEIPYATYVLTAVFTALLLLAIRRALRWGVAADHGPTTARAVFPVGRRGPFVVAVFATFALAHALIAVAAASGEPGHRLTAMMFGWSAVYGLLFVIAVLVVARTIPLDVVVDTSGVSFAGALHPWATIHAATRRHRWALALTCDAGEITLGPGAHATIDQLERSVREHTPAATKATTKATAATETPVAPP